MEGGGEGALEATPRSSGTFKARRTQTFMTLSLCLQGVYMHLSHAYLQLAKMHFRSSSYRIQRAINRDITLPLHHPGVTHRCRHIVMP
jgi:hypothetical protein